MSSDNSVDAEYSDPDIKEINYKLITTAGEIYKNLLSEIDNEYNGIDIRDISFR